MTNLTEHKETPMQYARMEGSDTVHVLRPDTPGRSYCNRPQANDKAGWVITDLPAPEDHNRLCRECGKRRHRELMARTR